MKHTQKNRYSITTMDILQMVKKANRENVLPTKHTFITDKKKQLNKLNCRKNNSLDY